MNGAINPRRFIKRVGLGTPVTDENYAASQTKRFEEALQYPDTCGEFTADKARKAFEIAGREPPTLLAGPVQFDEGQAEAIRSTVRDALVEGMRQSQHDAADEDGQKEAIEKAITHLEKRDFIQAALTLKPFLDMPNMAPVVNGIVQYKFNGCSDTELATMIGLLRSYMCFLDGGLGSGS